MSFLHSIPESIFETIGITAGLGACFVIAIQVYKEFKFKGLSSLSYGFVFGWVFIYLFWCFYGIRFNTVALWLTNGIAVVLQTTLCFIVVRKRKLYAN
ncbi:hypothetical protein SAMN04487911_12922 [Arenibacter nanhaiticus]|uniref:Sugar efflux transporter for intercellular exchange n=1 Tax=Arenibacter nanhaiticus TaxID=558155 RepID=A0A1M6L2L5_9FLAO|nr:MULTISPECIES: hypothetical protein [Arenibacter]NKI26889.1 hypothetical protein [Arenibacter sp. 6A1]SHJ65413.1 hypothetical protein SAMN04487911_12922 [Arenibacter nanhaiticus]